MKCAECERPWKRGHECEDGVPVRDFLGSASTEPRTVAGRALAAEWPFTQTKQTCCPYPHDDDSGPDISPRHKRTTVTETQVDRIIAIEAEVLEGIAERVRTLPRDRGDDEWDTVARSEVLALLAETVAE